MHYIRLSNDSFILHTSIGLQTITRKTFNYNKIQKYIVKGEPESKILPLLEVPPLPDGIYEAYKSNDQLLYMHTANSGMQEVKDVKTGRVQTLDVEDIEKNTEFVGIYASFEDLVEDWPEYIF